MNFDKPLETPAPNAEEASRAPEDLVGMSDSENKDHVKERSIEEEIAEMSDAQLLKYLEQIKLDFSAATLHHQSLCDVVGKEAEYVLALSAAKRIQEKKASLIKRQ